MLGEIFEKITEFFINTPSLNRYVIIEIISHQHIIDASINKNQEKLFVDL
jgi:hypothetical protein